MINEEYELMIFDNNSYSHQHFFKAIKTTFPSMSDKLVDILCKVIHRSGVATCQKGSLERLELFKEKFSKFGIKCEIIRG